jgi:amidase
LWRWDAVDLAAAIVTRQISSREATGSCLEQLGDVNPKKGHRRAKAA